MSSNSKQFVTIEENAHSKIMKDMIKFLDNCKETKTNCECSGILKFNPDETNEYKKWSFLYQCDNDESKIQHMENTTLNFLNGVQNKKEEIYKINKKEEIIKTNKKEEIYKTDKKEIYKFGNKYFEN